jgi:CubicO group peptidase (beta-lactamase class C family)
MTAHTIFRIASMSKPVTSVAALMLVDEGRLTLDDPITKWMPEFAGMRVLRRPDGPLDDAFPAPRVITVEDLLTHRSGLSYPFTAAGPLAAELEKAIGSEIASRLEPDEWLRAVATLPLAYPSGERFQYGISTDVLGFLVARVSGISLRDFLMTRVFARFRGTGTRKGPETAAGPLGFVNESNDSNDSNDSNVYSASYAPDHSLRRCGGRAPQPFHRCSPGRRRTRPLQTVVRVVP